MKTLSNKDPAEAIVITFDFSTDSALAPGETISDPVISAAVKGEGEDPAAATMLSGAPQQDGHKIMQKVVGGVAGLDYLLSVVVDTSGGQKLKLSGVLPVRVHA